MGHGRDEPAPGLLLLRRPAGGMCARHTVRAAGPVY
jgi:hypothetical protein